MSPKDKKPFRVEIHERPSEKIWKWINRSISFASLLVSVASIVVLILIQDIVNNIQNESRKKDRAIALISEFRKYQEDTNGRIDEFIFQIDLFSQKVVDTLEEIKSKKNYDYDVNSGRVVEIYLAHLLNTQRDGSLSHFELKRAVDKELRLMRDIKLCIDEGPVSLCNKDIIMSYLDSTILDRYFYMRPIFFCDDFFKSVNLHEGIVFIAKEYVLWHPSYELENKNDWDVDETLHSIKEREYGSILDYVFAGDPEEFSRGGMNINDIKISKISEYDCDEVYHGSPIYIEVLKEISHTMSEDEYEFFLMDKIIK